MTEQSRRDFLKAGVAAAALHPVFARVASAASSAAAAQERLLPFPPAYVRAGAGLFKHQAEINARYLDSLPVDRLAHSFRITAGISSAAQPYGGWEEPNCELRGHFAGGHFLSALALAAAGSGNSTFKDRGDELVAALAQCQRKIGSG